MNKQMCMEGCQGTQELSGHWSLIAFALLAKHTRINSPKKDNSCGKPERQMNLGEANKDLIFFASTVRVPVDDNRNSDL